MSFSTKFFPHDVKQVIERLKRHPVLGKFVKQLEEDTSVEIRFMERIGSDPMVAKGATTKVDGMGWGNATSVTIFYNLEKGKAEAARFGLDLTLDHLIGHELGHAYHAFYINGDTKGGDPESDRLAVAFENHLRAPGPRRHSHKLPLMVK
jgi:hypothetical protein